MRPAAAILLGGILAAGPLSTPAVAKGQQFGVWIAVSYAQWPVDPPKSRTFEVQFDSVAKINALCGDQGSLAKLAKFIQSRHADLIDKAIFGASCVTDSSGQIKIAGGE